MPRVGLSITKSCSFRNATQEFSNVYYFEIDGGAVSAADAAAFIDSIATQEKTFHATVVTFVRGRCWSQGGSPGTNEMIEQHSLSGTGARGATTSMDRERAHLFRQRAGSDSRGNPVYLRKYYHSCGAFSVNLTLSQAQLENTSGFSASDKTNLVTAIGSIHNLSANGRTGHLVSKSGRTANIAAPWEPHTFLEHHQLGDQWRAN